MFIPFGQFEEPSDEEKAAQKEAEERQQMRVRAFQHGFQDLFEELSEEHLITLKDMLFIVVKNTGFPTAASWEGMAAHALKLRFNICITCGVNHDIEMQPQHDPASSVPQTEDTAAADEPDTPLPIEGLASPHVGMTLTGAWEFTDEQRTQMEEYHLDDSYAETQPGVYQFRGFTCTGIKGSNVGPCGMVYPSIEDRMLKEPEDCDGCFQRAKHG